MSDSLSSVRGVVECPQGGRIVTMGFPGLALDVDGGAHIDPERLGATLADPGLGGCALLIALAETQELPQEALQHLGAAAGARGIVLVHMPIADYGAPDPGFEAAWETKAGGFHRLLDDGRTVGVTCHYGAGRSGTIAARLLIERGLSPDEAIARVRAAFAESIESAAQLDWLHGRAQGGG